MFAALAELIRARLSGISAVVEGKATHQPTTRLICSFQRHGEKVRLTWGFLDGPDEAQISGGALSGGIAELEVLEKRLLETIIHQIEMSSS